MKTIEVHLEGRGYTVYVGEGLLGGLEGLLPDNGWKRALIVTDSNVGPLYAGTVEQRLKAAGLEVAAVEVEAGEHSKSVKQALELLDFLVSGWTRADLVVALGGGVVGDLAGFVASVYKRGLKLLHVPTTLMAQVDSSIGGKTGVNLPSGKNLVGTFYQPVAVVSDVTVLKTLPPREFTSGLAEVAKYRFISPERPHRPVEEMAAGLRAIDPGALTEAVAWCAAAKAELVTADEYDRGVRAVLNYGYTLGHALETATGYGGAYTHGEAVSVGMVYAAIVSEETKTGPAGIIDRHRGVLESLGLPTAPLSPGPGFDVLFDIMSRDKKNRGEMTMVLLESEGRPVVKPGIDTAVLERCYRKLLEGA